MSTSYDEAMAMRGVETWYFLTDLTGLLTYTTVCRSGQPLVINVENRQVVVITTRGK